MGFLKIEQLKTVRGRRGKGAEKGKGAQMKDEGGFGRSTTRRDSKRLLNEELISLSNNLGDSVIFQITVWTLSNWKLYFVTECCRMILVLVAFLFSGDLEAGLLGPLVCYETLMPAQIKFIGHYRSRRITKVFALRFICPGGEQSRGSCE